MNSVSGQAKIKPFSFRIKSFFLSTKIEPIITIIVWIVFILIWDLIAHSGLFSSILFPPVSKIAVAFWQLVTVGYHHVNGLVHLAVSIRRVLIGWAAACAIAVPLGLTMGLNPKVNAVFDSINEFYRPIPPLAYYTLLIIWFGIGETSKILLLFLGAIPPLIIGCSSASKEIERAKTQAAQCLGAKRLRIFLKVIFPASLPGIITAMRISLGVTWTVLVASEIVASLKGIGWMVWDASKFLRADIIFVGIIFMGLTGLGLDFIIRLIARYLLRWRY